MRRTERKLIAFNLMTLDGYFAGEQDDISWHRVDEEVNEYAIEQLQTTDTLLFGRRTFQIMEDFWPTDRAFALDRPTAEMMGRYQKIVFSTTMKKSDWQNTRLLPDKVADTVRALKQQPGKQLFVVGSADLCRTLIKHDLIDEFRLIFHPIVLAKGKPFFHDPVELQLLKTKVFGNGSVLCCYRPSKNTTHSPV